VTNPIFRRAVCSCLFLLVMLALPALHADPVRVKLSQGSIDAYLLIRDESGKVIGTGESVNEPSGAAWRMKMMLKFTDGSVDEETTVYSQRGTLRVISDHHVQKGPRFKKPMDMTIDVAKQTVTWHDVHDGKDEVKVEHMDVPADLSNGLLPLVAQNFPKGVDELKMGYIVATPKPRVVKFAFHPDGEDGFRIAGGPRTAVKYRIHIELGGVVGVVAPVVGKEPPDMHLWVVRGSVPTFLKLQGSLAMDAPLWSIELTAPMWAEGR